ncbi:MAG: glycoside hydrolase family 3 C-terminal domain-containing protein [Spirochaetales bacterium]|nr:glycoside hydrolase family 3 C-terminal domain-containing protein [Spirochaetales bacterium]
MINHDSKARELLDKMNLQEKVAQMHSLWLAFHEDGQIKTKLLSNLKTESSDEDPFDIMKYGIGQITRPMGTHEVSTAACIRGINSVQKFLVRDTRLGIPAIAHEECLAGLMGKGATLFPAAINFGALWEEELVEKIAAAVGGEVYSVGSQQGLAPVLDVSRDARWGRTEETMGEDPYLIGCLASAYVKGLQGPERRVLATLKHYAGHSLSEGGRNHAPVRIGEKEMNDVFLLPFEMAVKLANAGSVMPAYHDIDGVPLHASVQYLKDVLRDQWGFNGIIVSDYVGINLLAEEHRVARDFTEATALAVKAGVDIELPGFDCYRNGIKQAIDKGLLTIEDVNACVFRVLREKSRLGLFENPYINEGPVVLNSDKNKALAKEAALKSIVLLKNQDILPLKNMNKIAVIGPLADDPLCMFGGYSFPVHHILAGLNKDNPPSRTVREVLTEDFQGEVLYSKGCEVLTERPKDAPVFPGEVGAQGDSQKSCISYDKSGFADAVKTAGNADCVIMVLGDLSGLFLTGTVGEGSDVSSLELPGVQKDLLDAVLETGKPVVAVMINGRPYNLGESSKKVKAIVNALLPGQEGASAISDILFGRANPGGKMPVSIPKSAGAMPFFYNYKLKSPGTPIQSDFGALYPFGFGLSYTSFSITDCTVKNKKISTDDFFEVSCAIKNTGKMAGDEVVQLYVRDLYASLVRPIKELKGFKRISLKPGEKRKLVFRVPADILNFTVDGNKRKVEAGDYELYLGNSSGNTVFTETVSLTGKDRILSEDWRMKTEVIVE